MAKGTTRSDARTRPSVAYRMARHCRKRLLRSKGCAGLRRDRGGGVHERGEIRFHRFDDDEVQLQLRDRFEIQLLMIRREVESLAGLAADGVGDVDEVDELAIAGQLRRAMVIAGNELAAAREFPHFRQALAEHLMIDAMHQLAFDFAERAAFTL